MLANHVPCQNSWLGQFLQLAASIASWYFCVLVLFVSWKPAVSLHSWGRAEASCWQGRRGRGWFPFGEKGWMQFGCSGLCCPGPWR